MTLRVKAIMVDVVVASASQSMVDALSDPPRPPHRRLGCWVGRAEGVWADWGLPVVPDLIRIVVTVPDEAPPKPPILCSCACEQDVATHGSPWMAAHGSPAAPPIVG